MLWISQSDNPSSSHAIPEVQEEEDQDDKDLDSL